MSVEKDFAETLAEVLGPLYRVSILSGDGDVEACFGEIMSRRPSQADIDLPRSSKVLRIELDVDAVKAAGRLVSSLAPGSGIREAPVGGFTHFDQAIDELISLAQARIGHPISQMSRRQKQQVVRFLDDRGAFSLRKSVETVADLLGVSRFTVYNYLDSSRGT